MAEPYSKYRVCSKNIAPERIRDKLTELVIRSEYSRPTLLHETSAYLDADIERIPRVLNQLIEDGTIIETRKQTLRHKSIPQE